MAFLTVLMALYWCVKHASTCIFRGKQRAVITDNGAGREERHMAASRDVNKLWKLHDHKILHCGKRKNLDYMEITRKQDKKGTKFACFM